MTNNKQRPVAKYLIADTFKITGRGLVFAGIITEGMVSTGDIIEFTALGKILRKKITGVEHGNKPEPSERKTGLLIKCENEIEIDELRNWEPNNQMGLIYKSE